MTDYVTAEEAQWLWGNAPDLTPWDRRASHTIVHQAELLAETRDALEEIARCHDKLVALALGETVTFVRQ